MADLASVDRKTLYDVMSAGPLHSGMMDFVKGYAVDGNPNMEISMAHVEIYQEANVIFHETIMHDCGNEFVRASFERIEHLPMLSLGAFAFDPTQLERERMRLTVGHAQHVIIYHAIRNQDIARAETNMREHGNAMVNYADLFLKSADVGAKQKLTQPSLVET